MSITAVIGGQWGDEGKGKIVDWLGPRADLVARFQGGNNAGHTLVVDAGITTGAGPSGLTATKAETLFEAGRREGA